MKPLPVNDEMRWVAERVVWFKEPQETLADPKHFLSYLMTYGTLEDLTTVDKYVRREAYREALDDPLPGVFDARSWAYWNLILKDLSPPPPMPVRFPGQSVQSNPRAQDTA
jgi:hypothetical protein